MSAAGTTANGIGFASAYSTLDYYSSYNVQCFGGPCGPYATLVVQPFNQSTGLVPCAPIPISAVVQFSFCLITGSASTGVQSVATYASVTYGVLTTTATVYSSSATYTVGSVLQGLQYVSSNSTPVAVNLVGPGGVYGHSYTDAHGNYPSDNLITTYNAGVSAAGTTANGIGFASAYSTLDYYSSYNVQCFGGPCGPYATLVVQPFNQSTGLVPCAPIPISAVVQFSFCLITGSASTGVQSVATYASVTYGVLTTTATVYSSSATYTVGSVLQGLQYVSSNSTPVAVNLVGPGGVYGHSYTDAHGNYPSDNLITTYNAGVSAAGTTANGIGFASAYSTLDYYSSYNVQCFGGPCGPYATLVVQPFNQSTGLVPCAPIPISAVVQFSFCLITGSASTGVQSVATYASVTYGVLTTTATVYSSSATYTVGSVLQGLQYVSSNSTPVAVNLVGPGGVYGHSYTDAHGNYPSDNLITTYNAGVSAAGTTANGIGFASAYSTPRLLQQLQRAMLWRTLRPIRHARRATVQPEHRTSALCASTSHSFRRLFILLHLWHCCLRLSKLRHVHLSVARLLRQHLPYLHILGRLQRD